MSKLTVPGALLLSLLASAVQAGLDTPMTAKCPVPTVSSEPASNKKDKPPQPDEKTYKVYKKAQEAYEAKNYPQVIELLKPLDENPPRKDYDKALVQNMLAYAYAESGDYPNAAKHTEQALMSKGLPADQQLAGYQNLVSFNLQADQHEAALTALEQYFAATNAPRPEMYLLKAQTLMQLDRDEEAICPTYIALKLHPAPKLEWVRMLADLHAQLSRYEDAISIQKEVLVRAPEDAEQILHLANLYLMAQRNTDAFALLAEMEQKGLLAKEKDVKNLAGLYWNNGEYQKSAETLERGIARGTLKNNEAIWRSIAQGWKQTGNIEKVAQAYGEGAKVASTGEMSLFQGEQLSELKRWDKAIAAYQNAIAKGGLGKNEGHTWLVLGYAQFRNSSFKDAVKSLEKAKTYPDSKKEAEGVLQQVKTQM